jgi:YHS domain-containing protein
MQPPENVAPLTDSVVDSVQALVTQVSLACHAASPWADCCRVGQSLKLVITLMAPLVSSPGLDGYCPVSLTVQSVWRQGDPAHMAVYDAQRFHFANERYKQQFLADPKAYAPVIGGFDVVSYVAYGKWEVGQRRYGFRYRDRTYLFAGETTRNEFMRDPAKYDEWIKLSEE